MAGCITPLPSRPPRRRSRPRAWEAPHQPNLTGTDGAYRPEGSFAEKRPAPPRHRRLSGLEAGMSAHAGQNNVAEDRDRRDGGGGRGAVPRLHLYPHRFGRPSGYEIMARLHKVDGLGVGTDVRTCRHQDRTVSDLTLDPKTYLVTVHMNIRNDVKIPDRFLAAGDVGRPAGQPVYLHHARRRRQDAGAGRHDRECARLGQSDGPDQSLYFHAAARPSRSRIKPAAMKAPLVMAWLMLGGIAVALAQPAPAPAPLPAPCRTAPRRLPPRPLMRRRPTRRRPPQPLAERPAPP